MSDHLVVGGQLGNYMIESVIGRGGMSVVYRAKHARLGMPVALKVLAPELSSDDTFRERFLREAQMAAGIDHPNVIPIHDMGLHEESLYIVMRYVAGGDLRTMLGEQGTLDLDKTLALLAPIGQALDAAHARGLVHRDVKPANILIQRTSSGEIEHVYLTDFGIAKSASFTGALTGAGASIGTVGYMAPEQLEGGEVSGQTDVYALAVTFYECLTGRVPFQRELAEGIRPPRGDVEPVTAFRPDIPAAIDGVLATALARNPSERYATCEQLLAACRHATAGHAAGAGAGAGGQITETQLSAAAATEVGAEDVQARPPAAHTPETSSGSGEVPRPRDPVPSSAAGAGDGRASRGALARYRWPIAAAGAVLAAGVVVVAIASLGSSTPPGRLSLAALEQVPTNHVTGTGEATLRLDGDQATITVTTSGLDSDDNLVHLMHIHAGAKGECPPASAARAHNGHLTISTTDGINYYGPAVQALTTHGDTSPSSILAFPRYLSGGTIHYSRTITLPASVVADIQQENAVVVVHGTDYDNSGIYSGVLDPSELNKSVPGTATAPALCGRLVVAQNASAPRSPAGRIYMAALSVPPVLPGGQFTCHAAEAPGAEGPREQVPMAARHS